MRILIVGASGQIGGVLLKKFKENNSFDTLGTYLNKPHKNLVQADITDKNSLKKVFRDFNPQIAVLCSCFTGVDLCEIYPQKAHSVNVLGARNFKEICDVFNTKPVFLSSEYIFDGKNGPYSETDTPNPLNIYGKTKLEGEKIISQLKNFLIIRTTVVYSFLPNSLNFLMQVVKNFSQKKPMYIPNDQYSNPTYAPDLAEAMLKLINLNSSGIFNVVGKDRINRYEFAVSICKTLGFDEKLAVPKPTKKLNQKAQRPLSCGLITKKLQSQTGHISLDIDTALKIIKEIFQREKL